MYNHTFLLTEYAPETIIIPLALLYTNNKLSAVIVLIILLFVFRKGIIQIDPSENSIVSPAEGYVESISVNNNQLKISIFLNPIDRHFQISPVEGIVKDIKYIKGKFDLAFNKVSTSNERIEMILYNKILGDVKIVQIAGYLFRRIVNVLKKGQHINKGEFIGLIKFSSKVELYFNYEKTNLFIKRGQKIKIGDVIANIKMP